MSYLKKIQKHNNIYFYLSCFIFIFILSINMNYNADEYNYSFITWSHTRITSIADIFYSQKLLYLNWTGRIIVHFLIQFLLFIPPFFYAIFNAFIFTSFIYLILYLSNCNTSNIKIISAFSLIMLLTPVFGETCIWLSGSLNYLWPSTLFLLLIKLIDDNKTKLPLIMLVAFLAGLTQEIILIGGFIFLATKFIINKFNKKYLLIFISFILGGIILVSSPGNFLRASSSSIITKVKVCQTIIGCIIFIAVLAANFSKYLYKLIKYLKISKLITIFKFIFSILFILFLAVVFLQRVPSSNILLLIYQYKFIFAILSFYLFILFKSIEKDTDYKLILESINYIAIGLTASLAMGVMPEFPTRSLFLSAIIMIIGILKLYTHLEINKISIINLISIPLTVIVILISVKYYMFDLSNWKHSFKSSLNNVQGENYVTAEIQPKVPFIIKNYYGCEPSQITATPYSITNYYCAKYYNVENIIGVKANHITIKIEKENIDKKALSFKYTTKNGKTIVAIPEDTLIEPSKKGINSNQAYFSIPIDAENVELINNSSISITDEDITTYSLN